MPKSVKYRLIERFPGYRFGSDGSVWSSWTKRENVGDYKRMSPAKQRNGYLSVYLRIARGVRKFMSVHCLILEAFKGPCPVGCEAMHFPDPDKTNNAIGNLRWGTREQNIADREVQGCNKNIRRLERHGRAKLTIAKVADARKLAAAGESIYSLAKRYDVDYSTMKSAITGKTWKPAV